MLTAFAVAALVAGLAGAWSPCGFSMVDTLAPRGYAGRLRTTMVACVAFAVGALAGGVATFGGLAALGEALGAGGGAAVALAVAGLLVAAAGDLAGRRIVPQVRRQVPESWRRVLPVPLAAALYGVLLGLGFTTFVLSFAVHALAAACLALGDPVVGLVVGLGFGAGRTLPVVVLAPLQETDRGVDVACAMAERPDVLRGLRAGGAAALAAVALVLALDGAPARAATLVTPEGTDPSAGDGVVAWQLPGGGVGILHRSGTTTALPGADPAVGDTFVVWREGAELVVADLASLAPLRRVPAPGAEEPAVSGNWLAWRAREGSTDVLVALDLRDPAAGPAAVRRMPSPSRLGRPALDGDRLVFHVARRTSSAIEEVHLATGRRTVLRSSHDRALRNPTLRSGTLVHVSASSTRQRLLLGARRGRDRTLYSTLPPSRRDAGREPGRSRHGAGYPRGRAPRQPPRPRRGEIVRLWTTALDGRRAYVTRIRSTPAGIATVVLAVPRR